MTDSRLHSDRNVWLATVRPNGKPHLIPIWFCYVGGKFYICTEGASVKVRNVQANPRVSVSLENGNQPLIAEGSATVLQRPYPDDVVAEFKQKYDWDISTDGSYNVLLEVAPEKWLKW